MRQKEYVTNIKKCNLDNKYMIWFDKLCKFGKGTQIGVYKLLNGKWSNICQISNLKSYICLIIILKELSKKNFIKDEYKN